MITNITIRGDADFSDEISGYLTALSKAIPEKMREVTDESIPSGHLYRRGVMTGRRTKALAALGLRSSGSRLITGGRFHRASAPGQPPAKDTDKLYRSGKVKSHGKYHKEISFANHLGYLDPAVGGHLNRPVLEEAITRALNETDFDAQFSHKQ